MKSILLSVFVLFSTNAFATGFTLYQIECGPNQAILGASTFSIHRFSSSAPGGPVANLLTLEKSLTGNQHSQNVYDDVEIETPPVELEDGGFVYFQSVGEGHLYVYSNGAGYSVLDIALEEGNAFNTNGPTSDVSCNVTR